MAISENVSFFESYPEFKERGSSARLGARHDCLIREGGRYIEGKRVLDLGSHDGRWSFAAVMAGAERVIGFEGRQNLIDLAVERFSKYDIDPSRYRFECGNALDLMRQCDEPIDTVFVFGIFYHIHNHIDWILEIRRLGAQTVVIDTATTPCEGRYDNVVRFKRETVDTVMASSFETYPGSGFAFAGHPSRAFVLSSFDAYGYDTVEASWEKHIEKWGVTGLRDYSEDKRATFVATRR